jgi:hypothetical protein
MRFGHVLASVTRYKFSQYTSTLKRTQRGITVSASRRSAAAANIPRLRAKRAANIRKPLRTKIRKNRALDRTRLMSMTGTVSAISRSPPEPGTPAPTTRMMSRHATVTTANTSASLSTIDLLEADHIACCTRRGHQPCTASSHLHHAASSRSARMFELAERISFKVAMSLETASVPPGVPLSLANNPNSEKAKTRHEEQPETQRTQR